MPGVHFGPDTCTYRGGPADHVADISLSYAGDTQLEVIAPVRGQSIYREFLDRGGPGLHHVCRAFDAAGFDAAVAGADIVMAGTMPGGMKFAYASAAHAGVPFIEFAYVPPEIQTLLRPHQTGAAEVSMQHIPDTVPAGDVTSWSDEADVVVIGFGIAGGCAAVSAAAAGARVLVLEKAAAAGGTTSMAGGHFYLGGGTAVQQATGHDDSAEEMYKYLVVAVARSRARQDPGLLRRQRRALQLA